MTASIQKDPGWGDPVLISVTDVSKLEGLQGKKTPAGKKGLSKPQCILKYCLSYCGDFISWMSDVENILNNDGFFADIADTPKEGIKNEV